MKRLIYTLSCAAMLYCCSDGGGAIDDLPEAGAEVAFTAAVENSRAHLDAGKTAWDADDTIGCFAGDDNANIRFTTSAANLGVFSGVVSGTPQCYRLYYPWSASASISGSVLSASLPAEQQLKEGTYDTTLPMTASVQSLDDGVMFRNLCGVLCFTVRSNIDRTLSSLRFAPRADIPVAGAYTVDMDRTDAPEIVMSSSDAAGSVCLTGEVAMTAGTDYRFYVILPPAVYAGGFTVTLADTDGQTADFDADFTADLTVKRSVITEVGKVLEFDSAAAADRLALTSLSIASPAVEFEIDEQARTATASREGFVNPAALKLAAGYAARIGGVDVVPEITVDGKAADAASFTADLSMPVIITLSYAKASGEVVESSYTVKFSQLTDTGLPVVYVRTPGGADITDKDNWLPAEPETTQDDDYYSYIYIDADGRSSWVGEAFEDFAKVKCYMKGRGNTTWEWPKKPYAIKLDKKAAVLGMPKHKRWVLLANMIDKSMMRNSVAFLLAKACYDDGTGAQQGWNPSGHSVELVLNGVHRGNYLLCEQIKIDGNRIDIAESKTPTAATSEQGYLLEGDRYWGDDPTEQLYWTSYRAQTSYKQSQSGKYIYATNYIDGSAYKFKWGLKSPDDGDLGENGAGKSTAAYQWINAKVTEVEQWIFNTMTSSTSLAEIASRIDPDSFIDYWLTFEMAMNQELNNPGSVYMYYDPADGLLHAGPVWDFDYGTFDYNYTDWGLYPNKSSHFLVANSLWYCRLLQNTAFQSRVAERWATVKPILEAAVTGIPALQSYLAKSAQYNFGMWSTSDGGDPNSENSISYSTAAAKISNNAKSRIANLDELITNKRYY